HRGHGTGSDGLREIRGDGSRPAAHVEQIHAGPQMRQQVAGGVSGGTDSVRTQHRLVVAVRVHGPAALRRRRGLRPGAAGMRAGWWNGRWHECSSRRAVSRLRRYEPVSLSETLISKYGQDRQSTWMVPWHVSVGKPH